jgi:hypothetical protein
MPNTILYEKLSRKVTNIDKEMRAKLDFIKREILRETNNKDLTAHGKSENLVRVTGELHQLTKQKAIINANIEILKEV